MFLQSLMHWYRSQKVQSIVQRDNELVAWTGVRDAWRHSRTVYRGPIGEEFEVPFEYMLAEEFVHEQGASSRSMLYNGLLDEAPTVPAYCLVALNILRDPDLEELPSDVLNRDDPIRWQAGDHVDVHPLSEFAAWHQELARQGWATDPAPAAELTDETAVETVVEDPVPPAPIDDD